MRFIIYYLFAAIFWSLYRMVFRCQRVGRRVAPKGSCVLVCNHISHFDPPMISTFYPRKIDFMAMSDLFQHPLANAIFHSIDAFPIVRGKIDTTAVREALHRLKCGRVVGIFPEKGIRSGKDSALEGAPLGDGAAAIAQMAGVDVHVTILVGTDQLYRWQNLFKRKPVYFKFGPVLKLDTSLSAKDARKKLAREIEESMQTLYKELKAEFKIPPDVLPKTAQERWAEK